MPAEAPAGRDDGVAPVASAPASDRARRGTMGVDPTTPATSASATSGETNQMAS